jgi:hypothetical protein
MNEQRTSWNIQLIERVLWPHDAEIIKSFKLQDGPRDDVIAWHYEKSGSFSVISAYRLAKQLDFQECDGQSSSTNGQGERPILRALWRLPVPQKVMWSRAGVYLSCAG